MVFELPKLAYAYDALEPWIDAKTMEIHHSKHHATYVQKLNTALEGNKELFSLKIEELLAEGLKRVPEAIRNAVRNHGGGHFNHCFFWEIMTPEKVKKEFNGKITEEIVKQFGSFENFKKEFSDKAIAQFGSGWAWLVVDKNRKLSVVSSSNQECPISSGFKPILCIDVWEHAYYLKFQNKRVEYVESFFNVINWQKVNQLFSEAVAS